MLEICGDQVNITIGFNVDNIIFKMGIIILESQSVLVFFCKILCAKPEKHYIDIYIYAYIYINISMGRVSKYRYEYWWTDIDLSDIAVKEKSFV